MNVLSWNLWCDGAFVAGSRDSQVRFLRAGGACDVVALQETRGRGGAELADRLGWAGHQADSCAIITPHPITERFDTAGLPAAGALVVTPAGPVQVWSVHLAYDPYGPYDVADGLDWPAVLEREHAAGRPAQIAAVLAALQARRRPDVPVLLAGDFNAPSHLDRPQPWPVSRAVEAAGLRDAYREAHPVPAAEPGHTWSPTQKRRADRPGAPEPQDRIDFVHYAGALAARGARTLVTDDWPSDHAAVRIAFERLP